MDKEVSVTVYVCSSVMNQYLPEVRNTGYRSLRCTHPMLLLDVLISRLLSSYMVYLAMHQYTVRLV